MDRKMFSPSFDSSDKRPASLREMRKMLIKGLEEEQYQSSLQIPKCKRACLKNHSRYLTMEKGAALKESCRAVFSSCV